MTSLNNTVEEDSRFEEFCRLMTEYRALNGLEQQLQVRLLAAKEFPNIKAEVDDLKDEIEEIDTQIDSVGHTRLITSNMIDLSLVRHLLNDLRENGQIPMDIKVDVDEMNKLSQEVLALTEEVDDKAGRVREAKNEVSRMTQERDRLIQEIKALGTGSADAESEHSDQLHKVVQSFRVMKGKYNFMRFLLQNIIMSGDADLVGNPKWGNLLVECGQDISDDE